MTQTYIANRFIGILILISGFIAPAETICAQVDSTPLTLDIKNATLKEVIKHIENTTEYSFIYGEEVNLDRSLTVKIENKSIQQVLDIIFKNTPIGYEIVKKHILLKNKIQKPVSRKYTISGYVNDGASSETLIGAYIIENLQNHAAVTNPYGFYSITLPEGKTNLRFSYLGYTTQNHFFELKKDTTFNVSLINNNSLEEVVVISNKKEIGIDAAQMGAVEIPMTQIKNTPSILGEADLMKTIQLMPGVQAGVEGSAGIYVRGGGPDQNLILLDGTPVYNVDHLFGFFSVFTPEAVKKVTLFKSSFPARFGGRLSSVIDVRTNDGDMNNYHGVISVGLLASKVQFEGPIIKNRTSFNLSARRSYIDLVAKPFMNKNDKMNYYFYDINAKINHRFSDRSRLFFNLYHGKDYYSYKYKSVYQYNYNESTSNEVSSSSNRERMSLGWGNLISSFRWNYIFNQKIFCNTSIAYNRYNMNAKSKSININNDKQNLYENIYESNYFSGIKDWSYNMDFYYNPNPTHDIRFGVGYQRHNFHPEISTSKIHEKNGDKVEQDTLYKSINNSSILANEATAYIEDNFSMGDRIKMNIGIHFSMFNVQRKSYFSIQPRLSARYQLTENSALKASYSLMSQYIHLLSSTAIAMPTDLWVPVTSKIKPMQAHQYSIGGYYTGYKGWELSIEGYYKQMNHVLEYRDGVNFFGSSSGWEDKVEMGKGRSMGLEFMVQKLSGKTTGWISYTLAKSDRKFKNGEINNGLAFPYKYDRRHSVDVVVNHKFNNRIDIGASWMFATGGTATIAEEVTGVLRPGNDYIDQEDYIEHRNNFRLPPSHRLNVGINFNKKTKHGQRTWNISIYNAYNAMNPSVVYSSNSGGYRTFIGFGEDGKPIYSIVESKRKITKLTILPCIPSVTYTYKF